VKVNIHRTKKKEKQIVKNLEGEKK
jgi:hypothetical protein